MKKFVMEFKTRTIYDMVGGDLTILTQIIENRSQTDDIQILKHILFEDPYAPKLKSEFTI
jgi:hypothetical protein